MHCAQGQVKTVLSFTARKHLPSGCKAVVNQHPTLLMSRKTLSAVFQMASFVTANLRRLEGTVQPLAVTH